RSEAKPESEGALNLLLWFERAGLALDLPANLCAGSADVRRYHPVPANRVATRVHYIWLVNAALNAETEHVLADAAAPIRLRRRAHGAHGDGMESLFRLVLLDVIGKSELRATDRCLLVETISRARQTNATRPALDRLEPSITPPRSMPTLRRAQTKSSECPPEARTSCRRNLLSKQKESPAAVPDFRLLRANLVRQNNGE